MTQLEYFQAIGTIVHSYLGLQYGVTLLGNKIGPGFVAMGDIKVLASVAHDFKVLTMTRKDDAELRDVSDSFVQVSQLFVDFLETTPFGASDGLDELGSSELRQYWDPPVLQNLLDQIQAVQSKVDSKSAKMGD